MLDHRSPPRKETLFDRICRLAKLSDKTSLDEIVAAGHSIEFFQGEYTPVMQLAKENEYDAIVFLVTQFKASIDQAVWIAARSGHERLTCDLIYDHGASLNAAVWGAAWGGHDDFTYDYLVPRGNCMFPRGAHLHYALLGAFWGCRLTLANKLVSLGASLYDIVLEVMCGGNEASVNHMLKGVDVNIICKSTNRSALGVALDKYKKNESRELNQKIILKLILNGADLFAKDVYRILMLEYCDLPLIDLIKCLRIFDFGVYRPPGKSDANANEIADLYAILGEKEAAQRWREYTSIRSDYTKLLCRKNGPKFEICYSKFLKEHDNNIIKNLKYLADLEMKDNKDNNLTPEVLFNAKMDMGFSILDEAKHIFSRAGKTEINNYLNQLKEYLGKACKILASHIFETRSDLVAESDPAAIQKAFIKTLGLISCLPANAELEIIEKITEILRPMVIQITAADFVACINRLLNAATLVHESRKKIPLISILLEFYIISDNMTRLGIQYPLKALFTPTEIQAAIKKTFRKHLRHSGLAISILLQLRTSLAINTSSGSFFPGTATPARSLLLQHSMHRHQTGAASRPTTARNPEPGAGSSRLQRSTASRF